MVRYKCPQKGSEYYIPEHEYKTVVNFCMCYDGWKMRLRVIDETLRQIECSRATINAVQMDGMPHGTEVGDPTGNEATRAVSAYNELIRERDRVLYKIELIEDTVRAESGDVLYPFVLRGITKRDPFYALQQDGMPTSKNEYGKVIRKIYYHIARAI